MNHAGPPFVRALSWALIWQHAKASIMGIDCGPSARLHSNQ
jgi:hypothetical protein